MPFPVRLVASIGYPGLSRMHDASAQEEIGDALVAAGFPRSVAGLAAFQRVYGLPVSGEVDPETLDALGVQFR